MSRPVAVLIALAVLFAPVAHAICPLNVRFTDNPPTLVWDNVSGATSYEIQESFDNITSRNYQTDSSPFVIQRRSSSDVKVSYIVTAILPSSILSLDATSEACRESAVMTLKSDPVFRALTRKAVIPIAGSGPGANGGHFKTALTLSATGAGERGRVIFHPAGSAARPDDPSIPYVFNEGVGQELKFDDVVAAMGQSGVGSLDIVPDEGASDVIPAVDARLYNDTTAGTFGTSAPALPPFDFLQAPTLTISVPASDSPFRVNAGLRTLTDTRAIALVYGTNGRLRTFRNLAWPADYTILGPIAQVIGVPVDPGESVSIFFEGAAIPFYTRTENRTNDPELFVGSGGKPANVGAYVE
ncbi:MAG TPA: hypothetical protein VF505_15205 [Thermoanaerobaculia bacterium]